MSSKSYLSGYRRASHQRLREKVGEVKGPSRRRQRRVIISNASRSEAEEGEIEPVVVIEASPATSSGSTQTESLCTEGEAHDRGLPREAEQELTLVQQDEAFSRGLLEDAVLAAFRVPEASKAPEFSELVNYYLLSTSWHTGVQMVLKESLDAVEVVYNLARGLVVESGRMLLEHTRSVEGWFNEFLGETDGAVPTWLDLSKHQSLLPADVREGKCTLMESVWLTVGVECLPGTQGRMYVPERQAAVRRGRNRVVVNRLPGHLTRWDARSVGPIGFQTRYIKRCIRMLKPGDLVYSWVGATSVDGFWHNGDVDLSVVNGQVVGDVCVLFSSVGCSRHGDGVLQVSIVTQVNGPSWITRTLLGGLSVCCKPGDMLLYYRHSTSVLGQVVLPGVQDPEVQARANWALAERNLPADIAPAFMSAKTRLLGSAQWSVDPHAIRRELISAAATLLPAGGGPQA